MDFNAKQIAAPKSWIDFENLCHALFQAVWQDPTAQKNGRAGQAQLGVDIFGRNHAQGGGPSGPSGLWGVQCKGKDQAYGAALTQKEKRIISLFRVIDSMMRLPQELDEAFQTKLVSFKEEREMQYITSLERVAADRARKEALKEAREGALEEARKARKEVSVELLSSFLTARFGPMPADVCGRIAKASMDQIKRWVSRAGSAATLDDVFQKMGKQA